MDKRIKQCTGLAVLLAMALGVASKAGAHTCPPGATATGVAVILTAFHSDGVTPIVGPVSECETIILQMGVAYTPRDIQGNIVAAFEAGTMVINGPAPFTDDVTPAGGVPLIGDATCPGSVSIFGSDKTPYNFTAADVAAGTITFSAVYSGGTAHIGADIANAVSGGTVIQVAIVPCVAANACETVACVNGVCVATPVDCDDGDACTIDSCDPASGCVHTPVDCNDNDLCTNDSCDPLTGCVYTPVDCNDNDACTIDTCDPLTGCVHTQDPACANRGCTPGFFKNCQGAWQGCANPGDTLASVGFNSGACGCGYGGTTFIQALGLKGGNTACGAVQILFRAAAAAYINACLGGYPIATPADVVAEVNAALVGCDRATILAEATKLDGFNNLGCKNADGTDRKCVK